MLIKRFNILRFCISFSKRNTQQKLNAQDTFQSFASDLNNKDVYAQYQKQVQKDTILKKFRKDVFKRQEISQQIKAFKQDEEKRNIMMEELLHKGNKEDVIKYSKKIMEKLVNKKKIFKEHSVNPAFSDYGDYSNYRSNFVKIEDRNLTSLQRLNNDRTTQNIYKFIDQLPDQFEQKRQIRQQIKKDFVHSNQNMSISDYGKVIQQRIDRQQHMNQGRLEFYQTYKENQQRIYKTQIQWMEQQQKFNMRNMDQTNKSFQKLPKLSPEAMNTIYECYLQGWTIRDISKRFGILPQRTKFCIWARAQLYDQFLPKYGWKYYYECLQREYQDDQYEYCDYGLDLDIIKSDRLPDQIIQWGNRNIDAQRKQQQYTQALKELQKRKKFDRHQKLQVGTHGKQNKMYLLKQWTMFRGKGSNYYHLRNKTFRELSKAKNKMVKSYY